MNRRKNRFRQASDLKNFLAINKNGIIRTDFLYKIPPTETGGSTD
ncbi:hypothetical protein SC1083_0157 [Aggregatibacter actinomycetemcomitans serotype e str. SC1083]|uniref:Uncharacterized protein n=1 Tax=Aggregatibacter actinomycetemcomitans serotype e str. SC1083 TaxID=907488 RepID=G4A5S2_AGGAC|nr:hypothetical protein SC1083_0157 [Aggregatibacter actinomycetemcomitans serotype e str. SC1083]